MKKLSLLLLSIIIGMATIQLTNAHPNREVFNTACLNKALNSKVSIKYDDQTINGTCQLGFKAKYPNELERGSNRNSAIQNACKGKIKGQQVVAQLNDKNIQGKCDLVFKSNSPRR